MPIEAFRLEKQAGVHPIPAGSVMARRDGCRPGAAARDRQLWGRLASRRGTTGPNRLRKDQAGAWPSLAAAGLLEAAWAL